MTNDTVQVYLRSGSEELTLQGQPELVTRVLKGLGIENANVEIVSNNSEANHTHPAPSNPQNSNMMTDFLRFYRKVNPKSQPDQILVITHYYQKIQELESLSLVEYQQAYTALQRIPVDPPNNLKSSVRNVVDRTRYLRNAERGRYMLTLDGEDYVNGLIKGDEDTE